MQRSALLLDFALVHQLCNLTCVSVVPPSLWMGITACPVAAALADMSDTTSSMIYFAVLS